MKRIYIFIIGILSLSSCSESFFDRYPTDSLTVENYMKTTDEVKTVLYAAYAGMRGAFANSVVYIGELPTDNAYDYKLNNSTQHIAMNESNVDPQNTIMSDLWYSSYQVINRCCLVIESMDKLESSQDVYNQLVGEAKFLRAYTYYVMVRVWGDVPLVTKDITDYMEVFEYGRTPVSEIYKQIISDLEDAEKMLPDSYSQVKDQGKVTAIAAKAILGDVYLTQKNYEKAKTYFEAIIAKEGSNLGLLDDYKAIFDSKNANNKEIIFAVQYANSQTPSLSNYLGNASLGNIQGKYIDPLGEGKSKIYGVNILMMTHELEAKFVANDKRRSVIYTGISSPDYNCTIPMTLKYFDYENITKGISGNPDCGCETIISRYADVILKYAECLNETGNPQAAISQIKRIRDRAGLSTNIVAEKSEVFKAIELERQLELNMEGHRWFDLLRTGRTKEVLNTHLKRVNAPQLHNTILTYEYGDDSEFKDYELLFPLPYDQVILNPEKLNQNPMY